MRRLKLTTLPAAGVALAVLLPLAAQAQMITSREGIALQNQILELKHQLQLMKQNGGNGGSVLGAPPSLAQHTGNGGSSSALVPSLLEQVQTLTNQVQDLRGRVDKLEHEVATQSGEINQEIGNLKFQLNQGGQGGFSSQPGQPKATGTPSSSSTKPGTLPARPPSKAANPEQHGETKPPAAHHAAAPGGKASLKSARDALARHDYAAAEADARALIARKGKGIDQGEAELVLAEALYRQGRHQDAAIAYDDAYNVNHTGPNAPDALLGLANSLSAIHQNQEACDTLDSLQSQFSSPSASLAARIRAARHRAHCE